MSHDQFGELEAAYGVMLTMGARCELAQLCDSYLGSRVPELQGGKYSEVVALFDKVKSALAGFRAFAYGEMTQSNDAGAQLENLITQNLRSRAVPVPAGEIYVAATEEDSVPPVGEQYIYMSMHTLMHVALALQSAIDLTGRQIAEELSGEPTGFVPGQAFEVWARKLSEWAVDFDLPRSLTKNDGSPAPFIRFFLTLNKMMPQPYRENIASHEALVKRVKRIRQKSRLVQAQGTNIDAQKL